MRPLTVAVQLGSLLLAASGAAQVRGTRPDINVWINQNVAPSTRIDFTINTRNVPAVKIAAYPVDAEAWLSGMTAYQRPLPPTTGKPRTTWTSKLESANGAKPVPGRDTYYSRTVRLPKLGPGVYKLLVSNSDRRAKTASAAAMVNVTNLSVIVKQAPGGALAWVTDVAGRIVAGARVNAYRGAGNLRGSGSTARDGTACLALAPGLYSFVVTRGSDHAGIVSNGPDPDGQLRAHFQTDRPIYRPGQTVYFKSILRTTLKERYAVPADLPCRVDLVDPKSNTVDSLNLSSNSMGSVAGQFVLPSEGMLGAYSIIVHTNGGEAYHTLTVAEYRKPQFKVDVIPTQRRFIGGEEGAFRVNAAYYFGAPVQRAQVHYTIRSSQMPFYGYARSEWLSNGNGNLYPRDTYAFGAYVADSNVLTDDHGQVTIPFPTQGGFDSVYSIELTLSDQTRQQVNGSASVPVFAAELRLGLRSDVGYTLLGQDIPVTVEARDLDGKPVSARVQLELSRMVYDEETRKNVQESLSKRTVEVPAGGRSDVKVRAVVEGYLTLTASAQDAKRHPTHAVIQVYVASPYAAPYRAETGPQIMVRTVRPSYAPGETVKAFITTNRPGVPMLVSVEGGEIWEHRMIASPKNGQPFEFRATARMTPNVYIVASQWVKHQYITGESGVALPDPANRLKVEIKPDRDDYRPGDKASFSVHTTDGNGSPVPAEVALSVVDEAIFALSPDTTTDLYSFYWGMRGNFVHTTISTPLELEGGAYQRVDTVAPLRQRFEDTAFWDALLATDASGNGAATFEMPGNLTTWRATGRGITSTTGVGGGTASVKANRPTMMRLAAPRQMVQGDRLKLIGTIDNRSTIDRTYDVSLRGAGVEVRGLASTQIKVGAGAQATVTWEIVATAMPDGGVCELTGQAVASDVPDADKADLSDAVQAKIPVAPRAQTERILAGGAFDGAGTAQLELPNDRLPGLGSTKIRVWRGLRAATEESARQVFASGRWGPNGAANQLLAASVTGLSPRDEQVREPLALISRTQNPQGWGWWDEAPPQPTITAHVLEALTAAHAAHLDTYTNLIRMAQVAAEQRYNQTGLWEDRARLAAALTDSGADKAKDRVDEVVRRGENLSPFARLRLAEVLSKWDRGAAKARAEAVIPLISDGPDSAFLPTGPGVGWTATDVQTTAQALVTLLRLDVHPELQTKLVRWLVAPPATEWLSGEDHAAVLAALSLYAGRHPESPSLGEVAITVNGTPVAATRDKLGDSMSASVPPSALKPGSNRIELHNTGNGLTFFGIEASFFRPLAGETVAAVRVLRRFEVRNEAGIWEELHRAVHPGEPVRCTVVTWGDDVPDAVRIVEPLPAGFELVEEEREGFGRSEVRDAAIIHYLVNGGAPETFRYYIRAEADGQLLALPASAEYIRRPATHGQSEPVVIEVKAP
ncbi:MAG TPA: MG2 domain-containing protein [Fimbriimonadaceae bacterium]|nr:MG2 domain-containing protein [Fimbriimonadaceae bacterium]